MSSSILKPGQHSKPGPGNLPPGVTPSSQTLLLDKLNVRRATPDSISEAVASSDDEGEAHRQDHPQAIQHQKPIRRASWLNDSPQAGIRPRQGSFASSSMSPTTSHPSTPSAEAGAGAGAGATAWGAHPTASNIMARPHTGSGSFGWGAGIWNSDRKEPPARLAEVHASPTSSLPSGNPLLSSDGGTLQTSPAPRESGPNSQIPFAIPIHPTPKNYRSQSYSVGQADPETPTSATMVGSSGIMGSRNRGIPHAGLQHRPSRPSMLSEMSNEGGMLGKVKEVDDDDGEDVEPLQAQQQTAEAKTIELLTRENAMLRHQQQLHASRMRPRASTGFGSLGNGYGLHDSVPEESSEYAVDVDDSNDVSAADTAAKRAFGRRMSEFGSGPFRSSFSLENRPLENVKKAIWSSSLGFGGLGDLPQSRRHSFADVPTRQPSIGSIGEQVLSQEPGPLDIQHAQDYTPSQFENSFFTQANPSAYFTGPGMTGSQQGMMPSAYGSMYQSMYGPQAPFPNRAPSPHRGIYGMPQPRHAQKLHIVLFKCNRADVFYIQEGTGLTVKPGDLVIVEADRGTDLGTVAKDNVDWATAKEMKEHFAEEHYKWLMMFSQNAALAQDGASAGLMAASNGMHGGAVGGMGPPSQHHMQEPNAGELKPKLIKRHAQQHEISSLREKEGSEAKAKRVCQSKVKDHGLSMEILDAEFQMDWKKLTFYYFADSYINFNSLVTDLFKIYKTRIWMSAINPASFASPSIGLQTPSGIGPGAVGVGRNAPNERRQNQQQEPQSTFAGSSAAARPFSGAFVSPFGNERSTTTPFAQPTFPYNNYSGFPNGPRPGASSFAPPVDPYATAFPGGNSGDYQLRSRGGFPPQPSATPQQDQPVSPLTTQNDWVGSFQGLSLNSR